MVILRTLQKPIWKLPLMPGKQTSLEEKHCFHNFHSLIICKERLKQLHIHKHTHSRTQFQNRLFLEHFQHRLAIPQIPSALALLSIKYHLGGPHCGTQRHSPVSNTTAGAARCTGSALSLTRTAERLPRAFCDCWPWALKLSGLWGMLLSQSKERY